MNPKADNFRHLVAVFALLLPVCGLAEQPLDDCIAAVTIAKNLPSHDLGPKISAWIQSAAFTSMPKPFTDLLHKNGAVVVTGGGTSINLITSEFSDSAKVKFARQAKTPLEFASRINDAVEPELKTMSKAGRFENGESPIIVVPLPGFVVDNSRVVLPENFNAIGNVDKLPLDQSVPGHAELIPLAELIRNDLKSRAAELGLTEDLLGKSLIFLANDALPVAANAAYTKLKEGQCALVYFIGTGTGSAKVCLGKNNEFKMVTSEESQTTMGQFSKEIRDKIPYSVRFGAKIAKGSKTKDLTLENISAGGRDLDVVGQTYKIANHLLGANTAALSVLLAEKDLPQWIKDRIGDQYSEYRKQILKSFDLDEKSLAHLLNYDSPDLNLLLLVKDGKFIDRRVLRAASRAGSKLARKIIEDNVYAQGLVAALIAMNVGKTPVGTVILPKLLFGEPNADGKYKIRILVRASAELSDWQHKSLFAIAEKGTEDAKEILLSNDGYVRKLSDLGFKAPKAKDLKFVIDLVTSDDLTEHADFTGLDVFSSYLRSQMPR